MESRNHKNGAPLKSYMSRVINYRIMKRFKLITLLSLVLLFSSCATNLHVTYPSQTENTGKVVLKPTSPTAGTFVTVNDVLVVDNKNVLSVTIENVPEGESKISYSSNSSTYKDKLNEEINVVVKKDKDSTKIVNVPPKSSGYMIYMGLASITLLILGLTL
jgi:hypothetical protein